MMSDKLSPSELLRLACLYAEQDRLAYLDSIEHCAGDPEYNREIQETKDFLKQLRAYRLKRWGKTELEVAIEDGKPMTIAEIWARCAPGERK